MFRHILHANDGSENAFKALETAAELAAHCKARFEVIFVEEMVPKSGLKADVDERKAEGDRQLRKWCALVNKAATRHEVKAEIHVFTGHPVRRIIEFAREAKCDLLVIGATGHADLGEMIFGSRADRMMHHAPCPVLVVR